MWCSLFPPIFDAELKAIKWHFPNENHGSSRHIITTKKTSPSLGPSVAVDRPTKRLPQHQLWKEMMQKTKQELGRLRKLPSIKGNDHRSPALQWSLFILNMELRKNGLEVGGLIYWISLICRDIKSINLLGNNAKVVKSNLIMQNVYESTQLPQLLLSSI